MFVFNGIAQNNIFTSKWKVFLSQFSVFNFRLHLSPPSNVGFHTERYDINYPYLIRRIMCDVWNEPFTTRYIAIGFWKDMLERNTSTISDMHSSTPTWECHTWEASADEKCVLKYHSPYFPFDFLLSELDNVLWDALVVASESFRQTIIFLFIFYCWDMINATFDWFWLVYSCFIAIKRGCNCCEHLFLVLKRLTMPEKVQSSKNNRT